MTTIEKQWFAYQLLTALVQCHGAGVRHGDIKSENVAVTTWNWLFLTDIAFFKPTFLPADNPADYAHFFDAGQRRRCYLAPERFYSPNERLAGANEGLGGGGSDGNVTEAMDIFSAGCVIAEIFLEGEAIFDLPQLLSYREGKYDPTPVINKITVPGVRDLVTSMINPDPAMRLSARQYLADFRDVTFPSYFGVLYKFFSQLLSPDFADADMKIQAVKHHDEVLLQEVVGIEALPVPLPGLRTSAARTREAEEEEKAQLQADLTRAGRGGEDVIKELEEFTKILRSSTEKLVDPFTLNTSLQASKASMIEARRALQEELGDSNVLPRTPRRAEGVEGERLDGAGLTMLISVVCSCLQNVRFPQAKLTGLELLHGFANYVDDEVRLGRIVPYCVALLSDPSSSVRATALKVLTSTVAQARSLSQADAHIFPEYILPALLRFPADPEEIVRVAYAQNVASLAESARRFLNIAQHQQMSASGVTAGSSANLAGLVAADGGNSGIGSSTSYDEELAALQDIILGRVVDMLTVAGAKAKRSLLADITRLCVYIGRQRVNNELLPHLITVLNDRSWELRAAFFEHIVGVSVFVGRVAFQNFLLPCIEQALYDVEEIVIQRAVHALTALCQLGLFEKRVMLEIAIKAAPLLCHPSTWVRNQALALAVAMADALGPAKTACFLVAVLQPFVEGPLNVVTRDALVQCVKQPLTRAHFMRAVRQIATGTDAEEATHEMDPDEEDDSGILLAEKDAGKPSGGKPVKHLDESMTKAMGQYLSRVASAMQTKAGSTMFQEANGDDGDSDDDRELEPYANLDRDVPLYAIEVEKTVPDGTEMFASIDKVKQDLYESLGVQVSYGDAGKKAAGKRADSAGDMERTGGTGNLTSASTAETKLQGRAAVGLGGVADNGLAGSTKLLKQSLDKVPDYIQKALSIPPPPPDLGQLRQSTVSTSSFYQNHHRLTPFADSVEPILWRPKGVLVASLAEHAGPVNSISLSRDNLFLASGSNDGTVKVWDCQRFKLAASATSQLTYPQGGRVTTLTVCDSSHSVASASDNGTVHVFKVEHTSKEDEASRGQRYLGLSEVKKFSAGDEGPALVLAHFNSVTQSLLVYGTKRGYIHGWDLRAKQEAFLLNTDPSMGLLSALAVGPSEHCLVAGTSRGFIVVWDLRFQIPIQIWRHSAKTAILSLTPDDASTVLPRKKTNHYQHPTKGPLIFAAAEGTNQVAAFDLYSGDCRLVFRIMSPQTDTLSSVVGSHRQTANDGNRSPKMERADSRRALRMSHLALPSLRSFVRHGSATVPALDMDATLLKELSGASQMCGVLQPSLSSFLCCRGHYGITGGTDGIVRYWDLKDPVNSYRICADNASRAAHLRYSGRLDNATVVFEEVVSGNVGSSDTPSEVQRHNRGRGPTAPSPAHQGAITDLKAIEFPQKMLATASRDGTVKIWV